MEILGVLASLLGIGAQASAQNDQKNLGYANLYETKRVNRKKEKLATSTREDAYGNKVEYDPVFGWRIKSTPTTKAILDAEQAETLASLTEDAARNRDQARRKERRSIAAEDEFENAFNNYKYRPRKSEADYVADATTETLLSRRRAADETAATINKQLLRTGNSSAIPSVFREARDAEAEDFEGALLRAKRQGRSDFLQFEGASDGQDMQELEFLRGIADDTSSMPQRFSNFNQQLSGQAEGALDQLLATIAQNEGSRQQATGTLMQVLGNSPDFAPLASALGRIGGSGGGASAKAKASASGVSRPAEDDDFRQGFYLYGKPINTHLNDW